MKTEEEIKNYMNELLEWYRIKKDGLSRDKKLELNSRIFVLKWVLELMDKGKIVH